MNLARAARGPVTATLESPTRRIARGETLTLTLSLTVEPRYWIESVRSTEGPARATSVELGLAEGLVPGDMRAPEGSADPLGGEHVAAYVGTVAIRVPVTAAPDCLPGPAPIAARVLFQAACEGRTLPPDQIEIAAELEVTKSPSRA